MTPDPELCFFITWLRCGSGCALLVQFNNFGMPSVLVEACERVIPTYFELILNTVITTRPAQLEGVWSRVVGVGKSYFQKIRLRADPLLADCDCLCKKKCVNVTLCIFAQGLSLEKYANMRCAGVD